MKRILAVFILVIAFCLTQSIFAWAEEYDVRKVRWGMSLEEIKNSEGKPMFGKPEYSKYSQNTKMRYRDQIFDIWCDIDYWYNPKTGLYNVIYYFVPQPRQVANELFDKISDALAQQYDNPDNSRNNNYAPIHTFANNRTVIRLSQFGNGSLEKVVLSYYPLDYWNDLQENDRRLAAEYLEKLRAKEQEKPQAE